MPAPASQALPSPGPRSPGTGSILEEGLFSVPEEEELSGARRQPRPSSPGAEVVEEMEDPSEGGGADSIADSIADSVEYSDDWEQSAGRSGGHGGGRSRGDSTLSIQTDPE